MKSSLRQRSPNSSISITSSPNSVRWMLKERKGVESLDPVSTASPNAGAVSPVGSLNKLRTLRSRLREQERRLLSMTFPGRMDAASQSHTNVPVLGSPSDGFRTKITASAQDLELRRKQHRNQELLERQATTIRYLQEELKVKVAALEILQRDSEHQRGRIAELEQELEQRELDDCVDLAEHLHLLRDAVADVYRNQMRINALPVDAIHLDGSASLASSGCSMKATVNAHFPLTERRDIKQASNALWNLHRVERRFLV